MRNLSNDEIIKLERQGCSAIDWSLINIDENLNLKDIVNVRFDGSVSIHEGARLINIPGGISGCVIRENAVVENVASIEFDMSTFHATSTIVSVLDETGSRAIPIFPGLSSQIATIMAREPQWLEKLKNSSLKSFLDSRIPPAEIGVKAIIKNTGPLKNISVGPEVKIEGASRLENGAIINNAEPGKCFAYIGYGVEAENFILEDGKLESKASVVNCYIGQGVIIGKGFSAHDSLFFANCSMENGEAHSILAGPFTVSMHKGTLLIGCQTSFLNAGSATNQSNHMYKLGPVHWGLMERGVKTASGSYLMLGAKVGAFSLLMGAHKTHPDSSEFPFSYLFGDDRGYTTVVPGVMLRSCGLMRDEMKWPSRDRRLNRGLPLFDHITYNVLNPFTIDSMLKSIDTISDILTHPADDEEFMRFKGMKFTRAALERAKSLYTLAIFKYLSVKLPELNFPECEKEAVTSWIDLGGQIIPQASLQQILDCQNVMEAQDILDDIYENYEKLELNWIGCRFGSWWRERASKIKENADKFDKMIEDDKQEYLVQLEKENEMLSLLKEK